MQRVSSPGDNNVSTPSSTQTSTQANTKSNTNTVTLHLTTTQTNNSNEAEERHVRWSPETVDNENMGRKKSNCILSLYIFAFMD